MSGDLTGLCLYINPAAQYQKILLLNIKYSCVRTILKFGSLNGNKYWLCSFPCCKIKPVVFHLTSFGFVFNGRKKQLNMTSCFTSILHVLFPLVSYANQSLNEILVDSRTGFKHAILFFLFSFSTNAKLFLFHSSSIEFSFF